MASPKSTPKATSAAAAAVASQSEADCRLIVAAGDKGATGKSFTMTQLIEWYLLRAPSLSLSITDPDTKHRTLTKIFGAEGTHPLAAPHRVESVDFAGAEGMPLIDNVVRAFAVDPTARISLVDGVANQFADTMLKWARDVRLYELTEEYGFRVTYILMMDEMGVSVEQARKLVAEVGPRADYLVVRNCKKSFRVPWDTAAADDLRKKVIEEFGGAEISLEGLSLDIFKLADGQATGQLYSIRSIAEERACPADSFTRNRAISAWARMLEQFDAAARVVLPPNELTAFLTARGVR